MDFLPFARADIDEETIAGVGEVLRSGWITSGPQVRQFEEELTAYFGGRPVRTVNSGTGTLEIGLEIAGVGPGSEVITTPLSWVATANVILRAGAQPVFVDVDPATRNIDPGRIEAAITPKTRAIIPVDLAGLPVDRDRIYGIARARGLRVLEDAAQSMGASWGGRPIGSFGDLVSFSFQANKNLTTGEGGCLVVNDADEARRAELLRLQGVERFADGGMECSVLGGKYNLTDIAARIGIGQLRHLQAVTRRRRELARIYFSRFDRSTGCELPIEDFTNSNWHMFQVVLPEGVERGAFIRGMAERQIGIGVHYPAIHLFELYRKLGFRAGLCPVAERIGRGLATLPLFPRMSEADVIRVCEATTATIRTIKRQKPSG